MKTVPSLVASSTVGIAAAGLALGRPEHSTPVRPASRKRKVGDLAGKALGSSSPVLRPATSSAMVSPDDRHFRSGIESSPSPQPSFTQTRSLNTRAEISHSGGLRRLSVVRNGEILLASDHVGEETRRESVSSRGSWIRRLSTIPNSQNNSPRSSVGPDSPSLTFSHGSTAPILSNPTSSPAQLPPNKLVKRVASTRAVGGSISRSGSKSQVPTLRRPATSHQRSVTLQQQFKEHCADPAESSPPIPSIETDVLDPSDQSRSPGPQRTWRPFFESRPTKLSKERSSARSGDGGVHKLYSMSRRVLPVDSAKPSLVRPGLITMSEASYTTNYGEDTLPFEDGLYDDDDPLEDTPLPSTEIQEPYKRARRSLSMHFSSPGSWISRTGSLRGKNRNPDDRSGAKRYSSAPLATMPGRNIASAHEPFNTSHRAITDPTVFRPRSGNSHTINPFTSSFQARTRNSSSPLPSLSRLSSFNLDLARLGLSSSSSSTPHWSPNTTAVHTNTTTTSLVSSPGPISPTFPSYFGIVSSKPHRTLEIVDRASTLVGSDTDGRGFTSGEEDDLDFQSETVFDSLRSGATGSIRSHNAPLDSMFDESPPSVNGSKTKRLSIHELLANGTLGEGNRIVEEDEEMSTPIKCARSSQEGNFQTPRTRTMDSDVNFPSSPPSFCLATKDFGRLSLDDEEDDEDWTRDDENLEHNNQLSPPSSSLNSRKMSPSFRAALVDLTYNGSVNGSSIAPAEIPKSSLFDWSELSSAEKFDYLGNSPRPKTAYAKQVSDVRGGRAIGRRGPSALHIRSQSVPVVPDAASQREHSKLTPKFGTWGLGGKGVSEEWDGDFEFESNDDDVADDGESKMEHSGMLVPPAIQASQENVVGHVGQIREVCLLVEDLKRLRVLAREKDLLHGPSAPLWKEAEGIIALAVPDEEDPTLSPPHSPSSIIHPSTETADDRYLDHGPDAGDVSRPEAPFEVLDRHGRSTGLVYDGNTVRRRSVFSPEDDIFGAGAVLNNTSTRDLLRQPMNSPPRYSSIKTSAEYARTVMETMHQHRSTSDPRLHDMTSQAANKMPFDTTSLRDLVHRASVLSRTLSDLIRKSDGSPAPEVIPHRDSSPAFTRVFTDPMASPPKHLPRSQSNNSILSGSIDASPTRNLGQRMHMMTVV